MKKIIRIIIFSSIAIYLTSVWDKGFQISSNINDFIILTFLIGLINYLIIPLSKIVLFPINFLTLGLASFLVYILALHLISSSDLITIKSWLFPGINLFFFHIPKLSINYLENLILSSLLLSSIINTLEKLL